jgi:DNA-binding transcriptional LysR family regulator
LIPAFQALQSGTRLSLLEEGLGGTWDALESDRADLVIAGLGAGGVQPGGGYQIHMLGQLVFDYAVAPGHPLAALAQRVDQPASDDEVQPFTAVSVADSARVRPARSVGLLAGQDVLTVATMRDKLAAQIAGLGVGFVPRFLAQAAFEQGTLVRLPVAQPRPAAAFCVAHRQGGLGRAGAWWVQALCRDSASLFPMLVPEPAAPRP